MNQRCAAALVAAFLMMGAGSSVSRQESENAGTAAVSDVHPAPLKPPGMAEREWMARQEAARTVFVVLAVSAVVLSLCCVLWLRFGRRRRGGPKPNVQDQTVARRPERN